MVRSGPRRRLSASTVARNRCRRPSGEGRSHHGSPRSPRATLASCTLSRASRSCCGSLVRRAEPTARRASINSFTSSWRSGSGMAGSVARQRRPDTMIQRPPSVRSSPPSPGFISRPGLRRPEWSRLALAGAATGRAGAFAAPGPVAGGQTPDGHHTGVSSPPVASTGSGRRARHLNGRSSWRRHRSSGEVGSPGTIRRGGLNKLTGVVLRDPGRRTDDQPA